MWVECTDDDWTSSNEIVRFSEQIWFKLNLRWNKFEYLAISKWQLIWTRFVETVLLLFIFIYLELVVPANCVKPFMKFDRFAAYALNLVPQNVPILQSMILFIKKFKSIRKSNVKVNWIWENIEWENNSMRTRKIAPDKCHYYIYWYHEPVVYQPFYWHAYYLRK